MASRRKGASCLIPERTAHCKKQPSRPFIPRVWQISPKGGSLSIAQHKGGPNCMIHLVPKEKAICHTVSSSRRRRSAVKRAATALEEALQLAVPARPRSHNTCIVTVKDCVLQGYLLRLLGPESRIMRCLQLLGKPSGSRNKDVSCYLQN